MRKLLIIPLIILALLALLFTPSRAFELNSEGIIAADQVINDDLFVEAERIVMDGTVNGNVFANGAEVIINGPVHGNLLVFGAVVKVNAPVSGSVAFVGQTLELNSRVDGSVFAGGASVVLKSQADIGLNLYFSGYSLQTLPGSQVGIDASIASYQAILQGAVARNVHGGLGALELDGSVGGDMHIEVDEPGGARFSLSFGPEFWELPDGIPSGLRISDAASVGGALTYTSPVEQSDAIALPQTQVVYQAPVLAKKLTLAEDIQKRLLSAGRDFFTLLILGALVLRLLQRPLRDSSMAVGRVLPSLGWGMVLLMFAPLVVFLLGASIMVGSLLLGVVTLGNLSTLFSVGGYLALALLVLAFLVMLLYVSRLIVANALGGWLCQRFWPNGNSHPFLPMLIGITLCVLIGLLPLFAGELFTVIVTLVGLGAMWIAYRQRNMPPIASPAVTPASAGEMGDVA